MKTLEDILQGVTPPETWNLRHYTEPTGKCYELAIGCREAPRLSPVAKINFPDKTDEANAALILRAARNFAPLVRALEEIAEAKGVYSKDELQRARNTIASLVKLATDALAQALADEP